MPGLRTCLLCLLLAALAPGSPQARPFTTAPGPPIPLDKESQGGFVLDGSFVHNVGEVHLNITNWDLIGSQPDLITPFSDAPSAMWPAGSGVDYLFAAGLWVGGIKNGIPSVSTGQFTPEFAPTLDPRDTIYEMAEGDPRTSRFPLSGEDDDGDGLFNEDPRDGRDNDGDGLIDEDSAAIGNQHFRATMRDNLKLLRELYPDHEPLDIEIVQQSFQWSSSRIEDAIGFDFTIRNIGISSIEDVALGFFADCDIGARGGAAVAGDDMVGFYQGNKRVSDGGLVPISMAYMYDCDGDEGRAPGYIGFLFLDQQVGRSPSPPTRKAQYGAGSAAAPASPPPPIPTRIQSLRVFSTNRTFERGGPPSNDEERYRALTSRRFDRLPTRCDQANDYRMLLSFEPFSFGDPGAGLELRPGDEVRFQMALVLGEGLHDLIENAGEIMLTYYGRWFDRDGDPTTGSLGFERKICDWQFGRPGPRNPIFKVFRDCQRDRGEAKGPLRIRPADLDDDGCVWYNGDCFFESLRGVRPEGCTDEEKFFEKDLAGCTGIRGREFNVRWWTESPPRPADIRVWPAHNEVHVFWDNRAEARLDPVFHRPSFEAYRIWRSDGWDRRPGTSIETGPPSESWSLLAEFDAVDSFQTRRTAGRGNNQLIIDWLPLGPNTGLEPVQYIPDVLRAGSEQSQRFWRLSELLDLVVQENPTLDPDTKIRYRDEFGRLTPLGVRYPELAEWECCNSVIDTLLWSKKGRRFYEYVDRSVHDGIYYFYSVTVRTIAYARPDRFVVPTGYGPFGRPRTNLAFAVPQSKAQTPGERARLGPNIYVVPNPATRQALSEFSQLHPNASDPTGVRIEFRNLPRAHNTVRIFTLSGDLIVELHHDGTSGSGSLPWNLVTRNGQQIAGGIYLFSVESDQGDFARVVGRFVVIR